MNFKYLVLRDLFKLNETIEKITLGQIKTFAMEVNRKVFNNELDFSKLDIKLRHTFRPKALGSYIPIRTGYNFTGGVIKVEDLLLQDAENAKKTIAHELIHAYIASKGVDVFDKEYHTNKGHGNLFKEYMRKINSIYGKDYVTIFGTFDKDTTTKPYFLFIKEKENEYIYLSTSRLTPAVKKLIDFTTGVKMIKTDELSFVTPKAKFYSTSNVEANNTLKDLYKRAKPVTFGTPILTTGGFVVNGYHFIVKYDNGEYREVFRADLDTETQTILIRALSYGYDVRWHNLPIQVNKITDHLVPASSNSKAIFDTTFKPLKELLPDLVARFTKVEMPKVSNNLYLVTKYDRVSEKYSYMTFKGNNVKAIDTLKDLVFNNDQNIEYNAMADVSTLDFTHTNGMFYTPDSQSKIDNIIKFHFKGIKLSKFISDVLKESKNKINYKNLTEVDMYDIRKLVLKDLSLINEAEDITNVIDKIKKINSSK